MTDQITDLNDAIEGIEPETPAVEPVAEEVSEAPEPTAEPAPEPAAQPEPTQPAPEMVPVGVVQELRRELREMKQAAQQAQQPRQAPPEPIDPEFAGYMQAQMAQMAGNFQAEMSEMKARTSYGDEAVTAAYQAAEAAGIVDNFKGIQDPWGSLAKWHQQQTVMQEVGNDPAAYKASLEAEIRAKVEAEMVAKQAAQVAGTPAPSLANVTGTGGGTRTTWTGPTPLNNVLGD